MSKLNKEDVARLLGETSKVYKPNPHETPGLAEALDRCIREHPMTWEEAHRASMGLRERSARNRWLGL
ncbi:MAG: hypothetical protein IKE55_00450 [Kiritimatiellae bacterium]|nr:hypothetical protein [Kiritimatiellia bacterium]